MARPALWSDLGPIEATAHGDDEPLVKHGPGHRHPYYIRSEDEKAALHALRATIDGPARMAPDVCGTLLQDSPHYLDQVTCDPTLPFGAIEA